MSFVERLIGILTIRGSTTRSLGTRSCRKSANWHPAQWSTKAHAALPLIIAAIALNILLSPTPALAQTEKVLYSFDYPTSTFTGCPPNSYNVYPHTGPLLYKEHVYGTTPEGGAGEKGIAGSRDGMVFELTAPKSGATPWDKKTVHSFIPEATTAPPPIDGIYPCSRLTAKDGIFYGSTLHGGSAGYGTVYSLTPPAAGQTAWTENILYNFTGQEDGVAPFDGLAVDGNVMYGVSLGGLDNGNGANVFQLSPGGGSYTEKTILTNSVGVIYNGDLLVDSAIPALFGTTQDGGNGYGNVFELALIGGQWTYYDLYDFTGGSDGAYPNGALVGGAGNLFGTTQGGGSGTASSGGGVLFELRQLIAGNPYTLIVQHTFGGGADNDGAVPVAGLYKEASGTMWGTTTYGGPFRLDFSTYGTIFKLYPDRTIVNDWHYAVAYAFAGEPDGAYPQGLLTEDKAGYVYGTTNAGGSANDGAVFQFIP